MKWLTEALLNIRTIKALAWEKLSFEKLNAAREGELGCGQATVFLSGLQAAVLHTLPWGVLIISILYLLRSEGSIEPHVIIVLQRLISGILATVGILVSGLGRILAVPQSFVRIKRFLAIPTVKPSDVIRQPTQDSPEQAAAVSIHGSFGFLKHQPPTLRELDLKIQPGELVGVIGGVASGKSALLQALIGELHAMDEAFVEAPLPDSGQVSYCSQVPWIFEGTVRENIICDSPLKDDRYHQSIHAAGLTPDLQILPGGDQVTIGSFGVRLSGGQRARVALARAAFQQSKFVLIDDPFASVDAPTGQHIFQELILGPMMRDRTRVVVTQPLPSRLVHFDRVLVLQGGRVVEMGSPSEVMQTKAFQSLQAESSHDTDYAVEKETTTGHTSERESRTTVLANQGSDGNSPMVLRDEEMQDHIEWRTLLWWFKAAGFTNLGYFLGTIALNRVVETREYLIIAWWIDSKVRDPYAGHDTTWLLRVATVVGACCFVILLNAHSMGRIAITANRALHHSTLSHLMRAPVDKFFDKQPTGRLINRLSSDMRQVDSSVTGMLHYLVSFIVGFVVSQVVALSVIPKKFYLVIFPVYGVTLYFIYMYRGLAIPLVFHSKFAMSHIQDLQAVVLGQCVSIRSNAMLDSFMRRYNYYGKSVVHANYMIHNVSRAWVQSRVFLCFGALTAMFAFVGLWIGMPMGTLSMVISLCFHQMGEFEGMSLGFTNLITTLNGLQRIVAYHRIPQEAPADQPGDVEVRHRARVDRAQLAQRLTIRHNASGFKDGKSSVLVMSGQSPILRASADGLSLEFVEGAKLSDIAPDCPEVKEILGSYNIVAVNGVSKSAELLAQELVNPPSVLWLDLWRTEYAQGMRLELEDITAGYGTGKSVLHGISIDIEPRMKCGFAGRTGCGKSTTLLCVLRLLEPRGGRILLGGRDASKMGLAALRRMVGLVPQDPTIFEGSWRFNVDPFGEFPDARIWEALQHVQLMPFLRSLRDGIDTQLERDGSNLSFGQRQLLSLARMVIRQPPVLLLDECTSALDPFTQDAVQKTLLEGFPMTTVVAIAHRVETIMNFDKVVVFDDGRIAEQGTVQEVMKVENGIFASMVRVSQKN